MGIGAVVHPTVLTKEALAAEGLHVDGDSIARLYGGNSSADFLHHADHLMTHGDARHSARNGAVLDVQIAGANARKGNTHDSIPIILQGRLELVQQFDLPRSMYV